MAGKFWFDSEIKQLLETNDQMVVRSLVKLYECQTADEQVERETKHHNGVGFSAFDASILSSFAQQVKQNRRLSVKQMEIARKKLTRYSKQLTAIANSGMPHVA